MKPSVLIVVTSDPRTSAKPAEAVRVTAGLGATGKIDAKIYLRGPAVLALEEGGAELKDEENFPRYWPLVREGNSTVYAEKGAVARAGIGSPTVPVKEISDPQLARLCAKQKHVLRF